MRFLCDKMLVRLGRWLRAAGHDTAIVQSDIIDREILEWAIREERYLLSRDRHFLEIGKNFPLLLYLRGNTVSECLLELSDKLAIDWEVAPFTRCLLCNSPLHKATAKEVELLSEKTRELYTQFLYCDHCHKIYWLGSHTKRMLEVLKKLQR